jgi:hypothetical protein
MRYSARTLVIAFLMFGCAGAVQAQAGQVTITYTLTRLSTIASNQFAIWVEDADGRFLRTLFVTDFTGRRAGWSRRPQTIPNWLQAAGVRNTPQRDIDAVSGATPSSGTHSVVWDLKDRDGKSVAPGTYRYRIEGNISWDNTVMWSGTIEVGADRETSRATVVYNPPGAEAMGTLISEVTALYEPSP